MFSWLAQYRHDWRLSGLQARLHELGYRQELRRSFNAFTSFACSLVLMANSSGITGVGLAWAPAFLICYLLLLHEANPAAPGALQRRCLHGPGFLSVAWSNGGPVSAVWGWAAVSITNLLVALSMAEIVSAYPIAGGPYFW